MSCVYKGSVVDTDLSRNSKGGTELMRARLLKTVDRKLLKKVAIHFSRPRELYSDVPNLLYCHDLFSDPENKVLKNEGWKRFDHFVFVSHWQRDQYIMAFGIPYSKCSVIQNAVEVEHRYTEKPTDFIRFIYHTTPHRGLELVYPIFDALSEEFDNIHLDVYSSFKIYGWESRDAKYEQLFNNIKSHPHMTYHGFKRNDKILTALKRSHIFLFPSIWMETSCIAMIEAIRSGCLVIHPSYGALPETASGATAMYDMHEDIQKHAKLCYSVTRSILNKQKENPNFLNQLSCNPCFKLPNNDINKFSQSWNNLLQKITHV